MDREHDDLDTEYHPPEHPAHWGGHPDSAHANDRSGDTGKTPAPKRPAAGTAAPSAQPPLVPATEADADKAAAAPARSSSRPKGKRRR